MNKVLVVFGGDSDEKEISALSATSILKNISNDFSARKINLNDLDLNLLDDEIIFIAVHGKGGEDGHLQKALETKTLDLLDLDPMLQKNVGINIYQRTFL